MAIAKKVKKAQSGVKESISMDKMGKTQLVSKTNTKDGPRYYKTISPSESSARTRNMFNIRANSADSVRAKDIDPIDMKKLSEMKKGGKVPKGMHKMPDGKLMKGSVHKAKDGKWIQKAVNPKHKGYCTPMTKATCTPKRKALAKTFKAMGRAKKGK
jgi:hypothetical protein